jgi:hypothetical protein
VLRIYRHKNLNVAHLRVLPQLLERPHAVLVIQETLDEFCVRPRGNRLDILYQAPEMDPLDLLRHILGLNPQTGFLLFLPFQEFFQQQVFPHRPLLVVVVLF